MAELLAVVNYYAVTPRRAAEDEHEGYPALTAVLGEAPDRFPDIKLGELQALAAEAYGVFVAAQDGGDVAACVNVMLAAAAPRPTCTDECGIAWEVDDSDQILRAAIGITLLDWLHTRGAERLGICRGIRCADAFADLSPSGRKIFCSNGCLNRHKVAEHRRRAKTA